MSSERCSPSWSTRSHDSDSERPSLATRRTENCVQLCLPMHQVHTGRAPSYLWCCVTASADITSRPRLRSTSSQRYERQRTRLKFGKRSFSCARLWAWNSRPQSLHELTNTSTFKHHLKAFLFLQAYTRWWEEFPDDVIANCISFVFYAYICILYVFWFLTFNGVYCLIYICRSHPLCVIVSVICYNLRSVNTAEIGIPPNILVCTWPIFTKFLELVGWE